MRVTFSVEPLLPLTSVWWLNTERRPLPHTQGCWVLRVNMVQPVQGQTCPRLAPWLALQNSNSSCREGRGRPFLAPTRAPGTAPCSHVLIR